RERIRLRMDLRSTDSAKDRAGPCTPIVHIDPHGRRLPNACTRPRSMSDPGGDIASRITRSEEGWRSLTGQLEECPNESTANSDRRRRRADAKAHRDQSEGQWLPYNDCCGRQRSIAVARRTPVRPAAAGHQHARTDRLRGAGEGAELRFDADTDGLMPDARTRPGRRTGPRRRRLPEQTVRRSRIGCSRKGAAAAW